MKKLLLATFLIGWFWGFRTTPFPNGETISVVAGPFTTKQLCENDRIGGMAFFSQIFDMGKVVACQEKKEV